YQGAATIAEPAMMGSRLPRATNQTGANSASGTKPLARIASPSKAPASQPVRARESNNAISIALASAADIGRSGTAAKLATNHPAELARIAVADNATDGENSRASLRKKNARNARLINATGSRAAHSSRKPSRFAAAVVQ